VVDVRFNRFLRATLIVLSSALLLTNARIARADSADESSPLSVNTGEAQNAGPDMLRPLLGIDVSGGNDIAPFAPQWIRSSEGRTLGFGFGMDKMLSSKFDIEVESALVSFSPRDGAKKELGLGAVDVTNRMMLINEADLQASVASQLSFSSGSFGEHVGLGSAGFAAMFGGRGGALPKDWKLGYLRAFEVHSDLGYSRITSNGSGNEIYFDPMLDFSFPYLRYLTKSQLPWPIRNLCVFTQVSFDEVVGGSDHGSPTLYETSGIGYLTDAFQISAGVQLPVNHSGERAQQLALLGEIEFSLDDVPVFGWMPF
jgi:hypothetical protein